MFYIDTDTVQILQHKGGLYHIIWVSLGIVVSWEVPARPSEAQQDQQVWAQRDRLGVYGSADRMVVL